MQNPVAVLFAKGPLGELTVPQLKLLYHLSGQAELLVVNGQRSINARGRLTAKGSAGSPLSGPFSWRAISLEELPLLDWKQVMPIVLHPCWAPTVIPLSSGRFIAMPDSPVPGEKSVWTKFRKLLCASATAVIADSESYYLEQSFRRDNVFLLDGLDHTSDHFTLLAADWTVNGYDPAPLVRLQRRYRADEFTEASLRQPNARYCHAVYRYLLGDGDRAEQEILASFEQAVSAGIPGALDRYYRFRSAALASAGRIEQAVRAYGHTAIGTEDRLHARRMEDWLRQGRAALVKGMIYLLNGDCKRAIEKLQPLADEPDAIELLIEASLQCGRLEQALLLQSAQKLDGTEARQQYRLLEGTALLLQGKRHEAIHVFLQAAHERVEALEHVLELAILDEYTARFAEEGGG